MAKVLLDIRDGVATITLNSPGSFNALDEHMIDELAAASRTIDARKDVRVVVLRGAGKAFCSGGDIARFAAAGSEVHDFIRSLGPDIQTFVQWLRQTPTIVVAVVQGAVAGGGLGLMLAADVVIAAEDAKFLYSEVRIGFVAALVATYLPLRLRGADIRELLLNPQLLDARRALEIGLVNRVAAREDLPAAGEALAAQILETGSSESIARTKRLLLDAVGRPLPEAMTLAAEVNAAVRSTADCKHGIATFLETKKPPRWLD